MPEVRAMFAALVSSLTLIILAFFDIENPDRIAYPQNPHPFL